MGSWGPPPAPPPPPPGLELELERPPRALWEARDEFARRDGNFLRGCAWAPDGRCLLSCSADNTLRVFDLPSPTPGTAPLPPLVPSLRVPEGDTIYDFTWFPLMDSTPARDLPWFCTGLYWSILVHTGPYWSTLAHTGLYWSTLVYTGSYWFVLVYTGQGGAGQPRAPVGTALYWPLLVHTTTYWFILLYTALYWFILVLTGVYWFILVRMAVSSRDSPVHLWDAFDGTLRGSF
ncbi:telomerase Cajal body protein 1, partial [Porphyrio hochstetteri]